MSSDNNPVIVIHHAMAGCSEPACGGKILCVEGQGSLWSFFFCSTETRLCSPWLSVHPAASLLLWAKWAPEGLSDRFCSPSLCKHGTQILLFWLILTCRPCQLGGTSCNLSLLGSPVSLIASTLYFPNWLSAQSPPCGGSLHVLWNLDDIYLHILRKLYFVQFIILILLFCDFQWEKE